MISLILENDKKEKKKYGLSYFGSLIAGFLLGKVSSKIKIVGPKKSVLALREALIRNKKLYDILISKKKINDFQFKRIRLKAEKSIDKFEKISGIEWPV